VKVVRAENGEAIYFSRSPVPHLRGVDPSEWTARRDYWAHVGVYGYDRATLAAYPRLGATELEAAESLEQLRFLAHGMTFQTVVTGYHPVAIDTPEDLEAARRRGTSRPGPGLGLGPGRRIIATKQESKHVALTDKPPGTSSPIP
jgi:3-deoxy-manno-octulosonate cytidylyltransferase (CMP-KDO synthetase)